MAERRWLRTRQMSSAFMAYAGTGLLLLLVAVLRIDTPQAIAMQSAGSPVNQAPRLVADKVSGNRSETSRSSSQDHEAIRPGLSITKKPVQAMERKAPAIAKVFSEFGSKHRSHSCKDHRLELREQSAR